MAGNVLSVPTNTQGAEVMLCYFTRQTNSNLNRKQFETNVKSHVFFRCLGGEPWPVPIPGVNDLEECTAEAEEDDTVRPQTFFLFFQILFFKK